MEKWRYCKRPVIYGYFFILLCGSLLRPAGRNSRICFVQDKSNARRIGYENCTWLKSVKICKTGSIPAPTRFGLRLSPDLVGGGEDPFCPPHGFCGEWVRDRLLRRPFPMRLPPFSGGRWRLAVVGAILPPQASRSFRGVLRRRLRVSPLPAVGPVRLPRPVRWPLVAFFRCRAAFLPITMPVNSVPQL